MRRTPTRFTFILIVLLLLLAPSAFAQTLEARLKEFDEYAARAGREGQVPGFAVAVVKDDRVVFAKGYGVRELGRPEQIDADTLFAVASNTKAFTAAAPAVLVDEGKLSWDDPVTKHLPGFQLHDPFATRELTVRDLLSHRSGLATFGGDLEHWHFDTFRIKWRESVVYPFPRGFVTFTLDARGKVSEMKIDVPNPDFDFKELEFKTVARP